MALKAVGGKYEGVWTNELKNGDVAFYINYRDEEGMPVKKKVGTKTKQRNYTVKDAYDRLIEIKHKLNIGEELPIKNIRASKVTFGDGYNHYIAWAEANKKSWQEDKWLWQKHLRHWETKDIKSLKALDIEQLKQLKIKEGKAPQTVKHILGLINRIFNHCITFEHVKNLSNPLAGGKVKSPKIDNARLEFLTKEQAVQILNILRSSNDPRAYSLTVFGLMTGARFDEIASLTWSDIDMNQRTVYFRSTKGGNPRHIFINDELKNVVDDLATIHQSIQSDLVIPNSAGGKMLRPPTNFSEAIEKVFPGNSKRSIQRKITFHSLRHTHASWLAIAGLDIIHIKEQLGHKTIQMTMRYSHLIPQRRHDVTKNIF